MLNFPSSLVKYSTPVLISTGVRKDGSSKKQAIYDFFPKKESEVDKSVDISRWIQDMESRQTIEEILNTIIAPREFHLQSKGQVWVQTAMSVPATRNEVVTLQDELNRRLKNRQANDTGICPVREELYSQCFDELIRQIIISFKKRGLLLACVRDQISMTISSYRKLYESSIAFGIRKSIQADKYKGEMTFKIKELVDECGDLQKEVDDLREKIASTKSREDEKRAIADMGHESLVEKIKKEYEALKEDLEGRLSGKI